MLKVYSWPTPNGHKVHIMLEECGLRLGRDWKVIPVNIGAGVQVQPEFLAISPNNKIPALVDPEGPGANPWHCSNPVPSCCIWQPKPASSCRRVTG